MRGRRVAAAGRAVSNDLPCLVSDIVRSTCLEILGPERAHLVSEAMIGLREANTA